MDVQTLVLDQGYVPLGVVGWERAITLIFQEKAEVVESYEDKEVRSVTFSMKVPSIIRFLSGLRKRKKQIKFSRENTYARDGGKCQYCLKDVPRAEITYDHIVPRAQGGKTTWENVVIACVPCNQKKGARTPQQAGMTLKSKPVKPKKLPEHRVTFSFRKDVPLSWKDWISGYQYWNIALDEG